MPNKICLIQNDSIVCILHICIFSASDYYSYANQSAYYYDAYAHVQVITHMFSVPVIRCNMYLPVATHHIIMQITNVHIMTMRAIVHIFYFAYLYSLTCIFISPFSVAYSSASPYYNLCSSYIQISLHIHIIY